MTITIERVDELNIDKLQLLVEDSQQQKFRFIERFINNWASHTNRFEHQGEFLLVATANKQIVGMCGLNIDPYQAVEGLGRIRHLYVLSGYRRKGIGSRLIDIIIRSAKPHFQTLNLRTDNDSADKFYLAKGFQRSYKRLECTHWLKLN